MVLVRNWLKGSLGLRLYIIPGGLGDQGGGFNGWTNYGGFCSFFGEGGRWERM